MEAKREGGLRRQGGLIIEWQEGWPVGTDLGRWDRRGQLYQAMLWDAATETWGEASLYVGAVVTRRMWVWTEIQGEEWRLVRNEDERIEDTDWGDYEWWGVTERRNEPGRELLTVVSWGEERRTIRTVTEQGWYFRRYPWSTLGRSVDVVATHAEETGATHAPGTVATPATDAEASRAAETRTAQAAVEEAIDQEHKVFREVQRRFVEDQETQGRVLLGEYEAERFLELVVLEEDGERMATGLAFQREAYRWACIRMELHTKWREEQAARPVMPDPSAPPLNTVDMPVLMADQTPMAEALGGLFGMDTQPPEQAAQSSETGGQGPAELRPQPPRPPKPWWSHWL